MLFFRSISKQIFKLLSHATHLDILAPVDDGVSPVRVEPADGEEGIALGEQILLVQVRTRELELDLVLETGLLLSVDNLRWELFS